MTGKRVSAAQLVDCSGLRVAGVDEAGRGPLAGPVVAAAVILDDKRPVTGLADSKILPERRRIELAEQIQHQARAWATGSASVEEIDRLNILQATLLAMQRAVEALAIVPELALVDGNQAPKLACRVTTVVRGDASVPAISAASILAKVTRDGLMLALDAEFPDYGFAAHKGYPTAAHIRALKAKGPTPVHRRSFWPVRQLLEMKK
jgi:ribonuclease HII